MSSGLNILNADDKITIVQNNGDQSKNLTIGSITDLENQLDVRYKRIDTYILLDEKENVFNVQSPLIFSSTDINAKPTLTVDSYAKK